MSRIRAFPILFLLFHVVFFQSGRKYSYKNNNNGFIDGYTSIFPIPRIGTLSKRLAASHYNNDDTRNNKNKQETKIPDIGPYYYHDINKNSNNNIFGKIDTSVMGGIRQQEQQQQHRRVFLQSVGTVTSSVALMNCGIETSNAAITDETDTFASNWWTTPSSSSSSSQNDSNIPQEKQRQQQASDEVTIAVSKEELKKQKGLGIELSDIEFRTNLRVYVKSIKPQSYGEQLGIQKDWIIIGVNDQSVERTNAAGVAQYIQIAIKEQQPRDTIILKFRDPLIFQSKLRNLNENEAVTTQVAPAGDTTQYYPDGTLRPGASYREQTEQRITVTQLIPPKLCSKGGASVDDLLEISYIGRVAETGQIFDGSAIKINNQGIAGRGDDVTLYFVLGKQPFGQFPPGWDVGLVGICIGERRRITIPPALAYGNVGVPRRNIPPNATLQYDVTLVSLNGLSTIQ